MLRASRASALGDRRGADDDEPARLHERLDVDVDGAFRDAGHRDDHMLAGRRGCIARVRSNRHQAAAPRLSAASSACCRMISREHAPPTNPSMRPSANTIARSPRCADTGARRATTVARANDCPSRRSAAICSKRVHRRSCYQPHAQPSAAPTAARASAPPGSSAARAGPPAAPETRPRRAAPPSRRAPTRSRTGCSTARTSHHRATAPLSPADPDTPTGSALQAGGRARTATAAPGTARA